MANQMVSFKDYAGLSGFGMSSASEVDELNKALSTGSTVATGGASVSNTGGGVLRVESLEATLRVLTFTLANIKLWKKIPKLPAFSTVEEYNVLSDYGADAGAFTSEGALPESQDSTYTRKSALVKFLGTTREVSHPATLVRPAHGNVIALETTNGAIWLVERIEQALFKARSDMNALAFDGIDKQILDGAGITTPWSTDPATVPQVVDLRGAALTEESLEQAANAIVEAYGVPTDLFLAPRAMSDLSKAFYPKERVNLPYPTEGRVGLAVTSMITSAGQIEFNSDVFLRMGRNGNKAAPASATSTKAPTYSAAPVLTVGAFGSTGSKFTAADAGTYTYALTAANEYGESAALSSPAGQALSSAGTFSALSWTAGTASGGTVAKSWRIYRSVLVNGVMSADMQLMVEIPVATTSYNDKNWFIPGCGRAYMYQNNVNNYSFRQLAPMMKIPLATIAASIRWMQLLYGTPVVYTPLKNVCFINVKDA
jgi:hypothetical protein